MINEGDVWKFFNKARKIRVNMQNDTTMMDSKRHFRTLLNGAETKVYGMKRETSLERAGVEEYLSDEEFLAAVRRLKKGKAVVMDGIPNEAWAHSIPELKMKLFELVEKIWNGAEVLED